MSLAALVRSIALAVACLILPANPALSAAVDSQSPLQNGPQPHTFENLRLRKSTEAGQTDKPKWDARLSIGSENIVFTIADGKKVDIAIAGISQLTYDTAGPWVAADHIIGNHYRVNGVREEVLEFDADKHGYMPILNALWAVSCAPLQKTQERGTHFIGRSHEIKSLGHPPPFESGSIWVQVVIGELS